MQLMIQLTVGCKTLLIFIKEGGKIALIRILLALLHVTEVAHVVYDLLDAVDPLAGHLAVGGHQVQVLLAALEDDGEALCFVHRVRVFIKPLRLATEAHGVNFIDGDWRRSNPKFNCFTAK